jgi:hypothetical protein
MTPAQMADEMLDVMVNGLGSRRDKVQSAK